jgi:hypothetical protein
LVLGFWALACAGTSHAQTFRFGIVEGFCQFEKLKYALAAVPPGGTIYIAPGDYEVLPAAGADGVNID